MYRGTARGMKIYDYIADVPDQLTVSGEKYILLYPPQDLIDNRALFLKKTNPLTIFTFIGLCVIIALVGTITILALQQIGYVLRGRPGQKIDDNLFEGGDGSVWRRNPDTGEWEMVTPPTGDLLIWAIVAIFIIGIVILILLNRKRLFGSSEGGKSGSAGSTKKKKDNPCPKEE